MFCALGSLIGHRAVSHYAASSSSRASSLLASKTQLMDQPLAEARRALSQPTAASAVAANAPADAAGSPSASATGAAVEDLQNATIPPVLLQQLSIPPSVLRDLRPPVQPYQVVPKQAQRPTSTPALYTPWTPTRALQRRGHVSKRMGFLMQVLEREQMNRVQEARPLPNFRAGDILEVRMMLPEVERKVAVYRGVCIARYHKGLRSTFKIYNVFPECGGVVQHIPLYMPDLLGIKVVGRIPASQERLYYLLDRESSEYTFQTGVPQAK
ncbi:hypothetical protein Agub_g8861 [Astrephomene gubernaculifera]|uniref:Ribosomal protein L19 n=1 Tax=Astrephomene gubernaculifera TaxID=47775 RepID=A0AAD3DV36_9CHLO|nr:hypothetical protein Agub_g8861 [Astrephomene gubernaculifera]